MRGHVLKSVESKFEMKKISLVYWSQSGNTEAMADAIAKGIIIGILVINQSRCIKSGGSLFYEI